MNTTFVTEVSEKWKATKMKNNNIKIYFILLKIFESIFQVI